MNRRFWIFPLLFGALLLAIRLIDAVFQGIWLSFVLVFPPPSDIYFSGHHWPLSYFAKPFTVGCLFGLLFAFLDFFSHRYYDLDGQQAKTHLLQNLKEMAASDYSSTTWLIGHSSLVFTSGIHTDAIMFIHLTLRF